jgi:hypothetical protein
LPIIPNPYRELPRQPYLVDMAGNASSMSINQELRWREL